MTYFTSKDGTCKRAKILTDAQIKAMLATAKTATDRVVILFSVKAGFRACEIAGITWSMVTDAEGQIADTIALQNSIAKGSAGGREIPMHPDIAAALAELPGPRQGPIVLNRRGRRVTAGAIVVRFSRLYRSLGFEGASSHSGRRTFITRAARNIIQAGGSIRDVQYLAGHSSLTVTQGYIEGSAEAKRRVVAMI